MTELLVAIVIGLLILAATVVLRPRIGIASPLALVGVGVLASFLPALDGVRIEPEWVIEGLLPPLLYAAAASVPTTRFRRDFGAIGGLSVLLLLGSALGLGALFALLIPGVGFAWGVALGAIVSPTDAVATSVVRRMRVSPRVVAILDGESLLNDATALVLLRAAIVAGGTAFSFWGTVGEFSTALGVAVIVGGVVGWLNLELRRRVEDPTASTVISFTVPFLASVPAGLLGGSGLVAAVVAGLILGRFGPRRLPARSRLSDLQNWRTVEVLLEGAVFLTMGLQFRSVVSGVAADEVGVPTVIAIAAGALLAGLLIRAAFIGPLVAALQIAGRPRRLDRIRTGSGGIRAQPLRWLEGIVLVWGGMRGAVTIAASQILPAETPQRSTLILIAFAVATMSLVLQGSTIGMVVRLVRSGSGPSAHGGDSGSAAEPIDQLLRASASGIEDPHIRIVTQRTALLDARDTELFDPEAIQDALAAVDADQIALETRVGPRVDPRRSVRAGVYSRKTRRRMRI